MPTKDITAPSPDAPYDTGSVLAVLAQAPRTIDEVAARVGARTVREVRALAFLLRSLSEEGRVTEVGKGAWAVTGAATEGRQAVRPADVLAFGFGEGIGPAAFARIRDNVVAATGKDAGRLHDAMSLLVESGHVNPVGGRSYVLTEKAVAERGPASLHPLQSRVLDLVRLSPATAAEVAAGLGLNLRKVRAALAEMHALGLLERTNANPGWLYVPGHASAPNPGDEMRILMSGPAERRAIRHLARPLSQVDLGQRLGVSRERARQIVHRLIERGLVRIVPQAPSARGERHLYVSTLADAACAA